MKLSDELGQLLGYRLQRATLAAAEDARDALIPHGITPAKVTALLLIRANPGCDQTALGRALSINRSSAMKLVNFLSENGLIERRAGRDLRTNALFLLPRGAAKLPSMLAALRGADARLTAPLTPHELDTLSQLLTKIAG